MIVVETTARAEVLERPVRALAANPPTRTAALLLNRYREIEASSLEAARHRRAPGATPRGDTARCFRTLVCHTEPDGDPAQSE
jgi:hypothetical protein